jgi:2-polyprenyl-3-methyl-5-hydroxy-6-metoxy-1,4-benzoquinol methylase
MRKMRLAKNLWGKAIADCYHKQQKNPFYICDEKGEYPLDLAFFLNNKPDDYECDMLKFVKGKILEIGCGAGRIMKYLQDNGHNITGFDIDSTLISLCKERGINNVYEESYINMEKFGIFDTIITLNRTIGIAGTITGVKAFLRQCYASTKVDGILIFDSLEVRPELSTTVAGVYERKLRYKYEDQYGEWFSWINFSSDIARKLLTETSWNIEKITTHEDTYCMLCSRG